MLFRSYLEKCQELTQIYAPGAARDQEKPPAEQTSQSGAGGRLDWKQQKEEQARKRKLASDLRRTEEAISGHEVRIAQLEEQFSDPVIATNSAELGKLQAEYDRLKEELSQLYEKWEALAMEE